MSDVNGEPGGSSQPEANGPDPAPIDPMTVGGAPTWSPPTAPDGGSEPGWAAPVADPSPAPGLGTPPGYGSAPNAPAASGPAPWQSPAAVPPDYPTAPVTPASPAAPSGVPPWQAHGGVPGGVANPSTYVGSPLDNQQPVGPAPGWYPTPAGHTAYWDGQQWLGGPPSPGGFYRPVEVLGAASQALLAACAISGLFTAGAEFHRYVLTGRALSNPGSVSYSQMHAADGLTALAVVLRVVVFLPSIIVFLVWLHRVFKNLQVPLRAGRLEHTPGWAVGWWFVPLANLVKPRQVVDEAWRASDPGVGGQLTDWRYQKAPSLLSWWWGCWMLSLIIGYVANQIARDNTMSALHGGTGWTAVASLLFGVAAILGIKIVRGITQRQGARALAVGAHVE